MWYTRIEPRPVCISGQHVNQLHLMTEMIHFPKSCVSGLPQTTENSQHNIRRLWWLPQEQQECVTIPCHNVRACNACVSNSGRRWFDTQAEIALLTKHFHRFPQLFSRLRICALKRSPVSVLTHPVRLRIVNRSFLLLYAASSLCSWYKVVPCNNLTIVILEWECGCGMRLECIKQGWLRKFLTVNQKYRKSW